VTITTPQLREPRYKGLFPVVPTTFAEDGALDIDSQKRCVDFMIDAGSNGLCILANFSEQFLLSDDEREILTRSILGHVGGRVPVIVRQWVESDGPRFRKAAAGRNFSRRRVSE
jgi:4-hydroxy-tetrahydrodipicolinate synthase/2-keto-3-deoxy-L-arabinonate dehydratase